MSTILNPKYLSMPEQVQKNKNDIEIINQYLQNVYKTSSTLTEDTTSINIEDTDIDINKLNFALLIDRQGHIYKIVDVIEEVVYLSFLTNIPGGTEYNFTGEWVSGNNEYYENDLVLYNGNLYLCELNVINSSTPPNVDIQHWSLFVGYGNAISEFVKSEYDKSLNKIIFNEVGNYGISDGNVYFNYENKTITLTNGSSAQYIEFIKNLQLKPNTTYNFNLKSTGSYRLFAKVNESYPNADNQKLTFNTGDTGLVDYLRIDNLGGASSITFSEIRLYEGSEDLGYKVGYGNILHKADIIGKPLWVNAVITTDFVGQTLNVTISEKRKYVGVDCVYYKSNNAVVERFVFENKINTQGFILMGNENETFTRMITFNPDKIVFGDCSKTNEHCVPVRIYEFD